MGRSIFKKNRPKFSVHYIVYTVLIGALVFSIVHFSLAALYSSSTPNPGHPWTDIGYGAFQFTNNQTALRTYTLPDADATLLTSADLTDTAVTGKLITGFVSGSGAVSATDTILQAINKLDGNIATKGAGNVVGPASATDLGVALFDGTTGKLIKNSSSFVQLASGNVGIGTANPQNSLEVNGASTYIAGTLTGPLLTSLTAKITGIPYMTSDTLPSPYVATASTEANGDNAAFYAFDGDLTTKWTASVATGTLEFDSGATSQVSSYSIVGPIAGQASNGPKTWTFQGSNDNSTWTTLDTETNAPAWGEIEQRFYSFTNTTSYRYYRLNITVDQGGSNLSLVEFEIPIPALTSALRISPGSVVTSGSQLILGETGDTLGGSTLTIENRTGFNGAEFSNTSLDLVDLIFNPNSGVNQNIRYEHRDDGLLNTANTGGEFQIGPAGGPNLFVGASVTGILSKLAVGSTSAVSTLFVQGSGGTNPFVVASSSGVSLLSVLANGNVGIGTTAPISLLSVSNSDSNDYYSARFTSTKTDGWGGIRLNSQNSGGSEVNFLGPNGDYDLYYNDSDQSFRFWNTVGGDRMTLTATGSVGIGTTSPSYALDVIGTSVVAMRLQGDAGSSSDNTQLRFAGQKDGELWAIGSDISTGGSTGDFEFYNLGKAGGSVGATLTLLGNGNVGIGTTSPGTKLDVNGTIRQSNCKVAGTLSANTSGDIICTSDARLKNILGDYTGGMDALSQITPQLFTYKTTDSDPIETFIHAGFIAQNVMAVIPEASALQDNGYYSLDTTAILATTVNAMKELNLNLDAVAGVITPLSGSDSETFVTAFFNNIKAKIGAWLADAGNGISNIFAQSITVNNANVQNLCVSDASGAKTCITKSQLDSLLTGAAVNSNVTGGQTGGSVEQSMADAAAQAKAAADAQAAAEAKAAADKIAADAQAAADLAAQKSAEEKAAADAVANVTPLSP